MGAQTRGAPFTVKSLNHLSVCLCATCQHLNCGCDSKQCETSGGCSLQTVVVPCLNAQIPVLIDVVLQTGILMAWLSRIGSCMNRY